MMSGPNSPDLDPLDYQGWGQCWGLTTSCNRNQKQFLSFIDALQLIWTALPEKGSDNVRCERLPQAIAGMCVSQRSGSRPLTLIQQILTVIFN